MVAVSNPNPSLLDHPHLAGLSFSVQQHRRALSRKLTKTQSISPAEELRHHPTPSRGTERGNLDRGSLAVCLSISLPGYNAPFRMNPTHSRVRPLLFSPRCALPRTGPAVLHYRTRRPAPWVLYPPLASVPLRVPVSHPGCRSRGSPQNHIHVQFPHSLRCGGISQSAPSVLSCVMLSCMEACALRTEPPSSHAH
jgi:hypothetical protein